MANIGTRPTVAGVRQQLEVHLLDVTMDLYGRHIEVLRAKLRNEQRFASLDALKQQIANDVVTARKFFGPDTGLISIAENGTENLMSDYKNTLNLPETGFPMRGDLAKREPGMLQRWYEQDLYGIIRTAKRAKPSFCMTALRMRTAAFTLVTRLTRFSKTLSSSRKGWPASTRLMCRLGLPRPAYRTEG